MTAAQRQSIMEHVSTKASKQRSTQMNTTTQNLKAAKERFAHDMLLIGGISYWGDWEPNYADDQIDPDYDTIPASYTITDRNDEYPEVGEESKTFTPEELADAFYSYARHLIEENKEHGNINRYFMQWAKDVIAYDLDNAPSCDQFVADNAVQWAMFGKQVYA